MNFLHRNRSHLGSYKVVVANNYNSSIYSRLETSIYHKKLYSWKKESQQNEWLTIKIGCDPTAKLKKTELINNRVKSTKYSLITFLPLNLLEQFRRIANFYFLVMTIVGCFIDGPASPVTSLLPLVFVITVTAAKQGYEDFLRYKTDNIVNSSPVTIIRNGVEQNIECQNVRQGDLVRVTRDCDVPCDLVLLQSSDPSGKCFITTVNLDGESNLKTLTIPRGLPKVGLNSLHNLGNIECELPKFDLYSFNGKILLNNSESNENMLPLTADNLLLRGSRVKNTETVIGCAIYTGMNTKLALNSRLTRNKSASSEQYVNKFLLFVLVTLIITATVSYFLKRYYEMFVIEHHQYLGPPIDTTEVKNFFQDFLSFLILFNYLIPISLYVTIEMNRVFGGFLMEWDLDLYDEETDQPCIVNTSNLNEELGQVNILFSDKTGTLTKNEMIFQQCSINGRKYNYEGTRLKQELVEKKIDISTFGKDEFEFFKALSVCHTIQVVGDYIEQMNYKPSQNSQQKLNADLEISDNNSIFSETDDHVDCVLRPKLYPDINPLLDKISLMEKRNKIVKRSPKFTRSSKIHPSVTANGIAHSDSMLIDLPQEPMSSIALNNMKLHQHFIASNLHSVAFNRSTSHIDLPVSAMSSSAQKSLCTHRRTQSYGANPIINTQSSPAATLLRSGSQISQRESYALPNFIPANRPSILRVNSQIRKKEINDVVENLDYQASSPDEKALIEACANLGLLYIGDDNDEIKIQICPPYLDYSKPFSLLTCKTMHFKRLHILEFNSDRKRMSVIVKDENDSIWVYTKGAESYVFPLCSEESKNMIEKTNIHITDFSKQGLRTLAVAKRKLTNQEYNEFKNEMITANSSLHSRKLLYNQCYEKIERNLELLGATAVEDALQDEVRETLMVLQKAGIKIWVLTGDKIETALNIALSCGHIPHNAVQYFITECKQKDDLEQHLKTFSEDILPNCDQPVALLIDGKSLTIALRDLGEKFRDVAIKCQAVLCCRLSPLQKCEVVQLIKSSKETYITASIGDGANDVSMIQEAHIGFGIVGQEGRQAARCADFSFANFKMLRKLLIVHGHYHTTRMSFLVLYFFYKNFIFMAIQGLMQFHMMFSTASVYDGFFLTLYNVFYTTLPILFISLTEKTYSEETLNNEPELYIKNTNNKGLHWKSFLAWIALACFHAVIIFYFVYFLFSINDNVMLEGKTADSAGIGIILIQNVVIVVNLKLWLEVRYQSYAFIGTIIISILLFIISTLVYNIIPIRYDTDIFFVYNYLFLSPTFYLLTLITVIASLLPDYLIRSTKSVLNLPKNFLLLNRPKNYTNKVFIANENGIRIQSTYL